MIKRKPTVMVEIPLRTAQRIVYCLDQLRTLYLFLSESTSPYHMIGVMRGFVIELQLFVWPTYANFKEDFRILSAAITKHPWPSEEDVNKTVDG